MTTDIFSSSERPPPARSWLAWGSLPADLHFDDRGGVNLPSCSQTKTRGGQKKKKKKKGAGGGTP